MTKSVKLITFSVAMYLIFMLLLTPAAWWLKLLPLPATVQLGAVTGTLVQGKIGAVQYQQLYFSELSWQLKGWQLLTGKLQFDIKSGSAKQPNLPYIKATASYGLTGSSLQNSMLKLPVAQVLPMLSLPLPVAATGDLVLDITSFSQGQPKCKTLKGYASWQDAKLQTPTGRWLDLQSLFAELSCVNGTLVMTTDGANKLGLDIKAVINAEQLLVNGTVKPDADMPEEVHQAMQFLGKPDAKGRYTVKL